MESTCICYIILRSSESFDDEQELSFVRTIVIEETGAEFQHSVDIMLIRKYVKSMYPNIRFNCLKISKEN